MKCEATGCTGASRVRHYPPSIARTDPLTRAVTGELYDYDADAVDPDGTTVTYAFDADGTDPAILADATLDVSTGRLVWTPATAGLYPVALLATDATGSQAPQGYDVLVSDSPPPPPDLPSGGNTPPWFLPPWSATTHPRDLPYVYTLTTFDPDGDEVVLTVTATSDSPAVDFDPAVHLLDRTISWPVPDDVPTGTTIDFVATVADRGGYGTLGWTLTIGDVNTPPRIELPPRIDLVAGQSLSHATRWTDPDRGDAITFTLDDDSIARGLRVTDTGRITWATEVGMPPLENVPLRVTISDGHDTASATTLVSVTPDVTPPEVRIVARPETVPLGDPIEVRMAVRDELRIASRSMKLHSVTTLAGTTRVLDRPLRIPVDGVVRLLPDASLVGTLRFVATATNAAGLTGTSDFAEVLVALSDADNPDGVTSAPPRVDLLPIDEDEINARGHVVGLAPVLGGASVDRTFDASNTIVRWALTATDPTGVRRTLADHTTTAAEPTDAAAPLATFDATALSAGLYTLELSVTDAYGRTARDRETVSVGDEFKLGNFRLEFTDLEIPLGGIPVTVRRIYDSLDAAKDGDFGFGWSMDVIEPSIAVNQASLGPSDLTTGYRAFPENSIVEVRTPEGTVENFRLRWDTGPNLGTLNTITGGNAARPVFVPLSGSSRYTLVAPAGTGPYSAAGSNSGIFRDLSGRAYSAFDPAAGSFQLIDTADPSRHLTYTFAAGDFTRLTSVSDKYGNTIRHDGDDLVAARRTIPGDNTSPTVDTGRRLTINRDRHGRVTTIVDPVGGTLAYVYDEAGRLVEFYDRRAAARHLDDIEGNEFEPTRFGYDLRESIRRFELSEDRSPTDAELDRYLADLPGGENFLSTITDPLGLDALRVNFRPDGRIGTLLDAEDNPSTLRYDLTPGESRVTSSSPTTTATSQDFDRFGRPIRSIDTEGNQTLFQYATDDDFYPLQTIEVVGDVDSPARWADRSGDDRVTTREYDARWTEQVIRETDPEGETTRTVYFYKTGVPKEQFTPDGKRVQFTWFDFTGDGVEELSTRNTWYADYTGYGYDRWGNATSIATGLNGDTRWPSGRYLVNGMGHFVSGSTTGMLYDTLGQLVTAIDPDGNRRSIRYDDAGRMTGTTTSIYPDARRPVFDGGLRPPVTFVPDGPPITPPIPAPPPTRTLLHTETDLDIAGDTRGTLTRVEHQVWDDAFEPDDPAGYRTIDTEIRHESGTTDYDALGRPYLSTDDNGLRTITVYDPRGLVAETWTEAAGTDGVSHFTVARNVYDAQGRAVWTTGAIAPDADPASVVGTHSVYDDADPLTTFLTAFPGTGPVETGTGRMLGSEQLRGTVIVSTAHPAADFIDVSHDGTTISIPTLAGTALASSGTVVSASRSFHDDNGRTIRTEDDHALLSETLYDAHGRVVESRRQLPPAFGTSESLWSVTRTLYAVDGKTLATTEPLIVPAHTPLGGDLSDRSVRLTTTTYGLYDRVEQTTTRHDATLRTLPPTADGHAGGFEILDDGVPIFRTRTVYDEGGRAFATATYDLTIEEESHAHDQLSASAGFTLDQNGTKADRFVLGSGVLSQQLFDGRGRQVATLGHPQPIDNVAPAGDDPLRPAVSAILPADLTLGEVLVRSRTETGYDHLGRANLQRSGLVQVHRRDGKLIGVVAEDAVDVITHFDDYGNVVRTETVTGGSFTHHLDRLSYIDSDGDTSVRTGGTLEHYTLTRYDDDNRPVAISEPVPGGVVAVWDEEQQSFVVAADSPTHPRPADADGTYDAGDRLPTKLNHYDEQGRLLGVTLPHVSSRAETDAHIRPRYDYAYDHRGNQTRLTDPLGRETIWTFDDRGRELTRTLPLGVDAQDGAAPRPGDFHTEDRFYDDEGRLKWHTSFEGVITENVYDDYGRMVAINYYADEADRADGRPSERDEYTHNARGGQQTWTRYRSESSTTVPGVTSAPYRAAIDDPTAWTELRHEATFRDDRGRVVHEISNEGSLSYGYDAAGRMTFTAVNADAPSLPLPPGGTVPPADPTTADRLTRYEYDALGRLSRVTEDATPSVTTDDPEVTTDYAYDHHGRQSSMLRTTEVTMPSIETVMQYDRLGRLDELTDYRGTPELRTSDLGVIGQGVAVDDDATGTGYILHSDAPLADRFPSAPPHGGNSDQLIAVRHQAGRWQYNDNTTAWHDFTPLPGDRLIAQVDFDADTIDGLEGTATAIHGITAGYASGDLQFFADRWNGAANNGEFTVTGTSFEAVEHDTMAHYDYTVRPDGKRTGLTETFTHDANGDGVITDDEKRTTTYAWRYDGLGRLTDEVLDHWDSDVDQTEVYTYDDVGNRTEVARHSVASPPATLTDATASTVTAYRYDANDRLFAELADDRTAADADTTTVHRFADTQTTGNVIYDGLLDEATLEAITQTGTDTGQIRLSDQTRTYDLRGRLQSLTNQTHTDGQPSVRKRSTYTYDRRNFRVTQTVHRTDPETGNWKLATETSFLADHHTHTGYTQTQRETTTDHATGETTVIDYTFGHDELVQTTTTTDADGNTTTERLTFGHDGHGSVRATYTDTAEIRQTYTFSAYGVRLQVHDADGNIVPTDDIATQMAYAGEFFDAVAKHSYNRARFYNAVTAQWNRRDDYIGGNTDPQSLHKYAYVHSNPISSLDPSGLQEFTVAGVSVNLTLPSARTFQSFGAFKAYTFVLFFEVSIQIAELVFIYEVFDFTMSLTIMGIDAIPDSYANPNQGSDAAVEPYEVGEYEDLRTRAAANNQGGTLQIHHAPQKAVAAQVVDGYEPLPANNAPAIALPIDEHKQITSAQFSKAKDRFASQPTQEDLLARDMFHIRKYTAAPVSSLKNLAGMLKGRYPSLFNRYRR